MTEKLTVIIPCKDEEANILGCIHSARKVADEILVADSGSTDRTLEMVRGLDGVRIIEREYVNSGDFKNWAIPQARQTWVLILDADERIPDALADEINKLLRHGPEEDGYWVYRASFFMGHRVRFSGWQNDRVLRLFRRDLGTYQGDNDHAEVAIRSGRVHRLKNRMLHYSYWTYHDYFQRMQRYSTYQALKWQEQGRTVSLPKLFLNLPLRFLQLYFLRLGFLDGLVGLQVCALTAMYSFSKQACLWQLLHGRSREEVNQQVADISITEESTAFHHRVVIGQGAIGQGGIGQGGIGQGAIDQSAIDQSAIDQSACDTTRCPDTRVAAIDIASEGPLAQQALNALTFRHVRGVADGAAVFVHRTGGSAVGHGDGQVCPENSMTADGNDVNQGG